MRLRSSDPAPLPWCLLACMCSVSYNYSYPSLLAEEQSKKSSSAAMEVEAEASYSCGFLPAGRHPPYRPPPPHPAEDGELWEYFPCPFCYIEVEVPFICNHLQEEHCFDTKNAVCPICADNLGKDMSAHFRVQHSHLLKRRKPSKPNSWPAASGNKEPYEVNSYSEGPYQMNTYMVNRSYQDPPPDPLLSQFICSIDEIESKSHSGVSHCENVISAIPEVQRPNQHVTQLELEERLQRIEFLKEIFMSTIL